MRFSRRRTRIGESDTLRVSRKALDLKRRGVDLVDFGAGEPDFDSPPAAIEAAIRALEGGFTKYTQGTGIPELREALAGSYGRRYGAAWTAADVVVSVGAKASLFELALALFEEGSEVVVPSPFWVSFPQQIAFAGAGVVAPPMSREDGFRIHPDPLIEALTDRTRAVLVNSPCNPTGGILEERDLRTLVEVCAERGILFIADETYESFVYGGASHASASSLAPEFPDTVVVVSSFSKTYAMTGWRLGYCLGPKAVIAAVAAIQSHATSNPTSFAMKGAVAALAEGEGQVASMVAEFEARRNLLVAGLGEIPGVRCVSPPGAFYAFPHVAAHYREGRRGSTELAEFLLDEARVAVVPGGAFGDDDHIRISFACSRESLAEGLERIRSALDRG